MPSVAWSGEALAGLWVSRSELEPVWVAVLVFWGDVPSRGHSTAAAPDGCATTATATSFLPPRARGTGWQCCAWLSGVSCCILGACELRAGRRAFSCSAPSSPSHCRRLAQPGRYRHAPGSCCNPASHQAEFKPSFPVCFQTEKWESSGTSVPEAGTFPSRLKDKNPFPNVWHQPWAQLPAASWGTAWVARKDRGVLRPTQYPAWVSDASLVQTPNAGEWGRIRPSVSPPPSCF